jgi:hypothetical protein
MNFSANAILFVGGLFNLGFVLFHLLFWKIFQWKKDLASLTHINRSIMQILNLRLTFLLLVMAYLSFFHIAELVSTSIGQALLVSFSLFWFHRAIEQIIFFGIKNRISLALTVVFLMGGILYLLPGVRYVNYF